MLPTTDGPESSAAPPSRGARALRMLPVLGLLAAAAVLGYSALGGSSAAPASPLDLKLELGKPFVQGIISVFDMHVDQITLQKPPSQWAHFAVGASAAL